MTKLPPMSTLRPFEATARLSSFSRAADELNVSQAAISKQIANLENFIGTPLFERRGRQIFLTNAGVRLHEAVTLGLSHISTTLEKLTRNQAPEQVAIAMRLAFASQFMASQVTDLQSRHPTLDIALVTTESNPEFMFDSVDMAVVLGHEPQPQLHADFLFSEELFPVCSPAYLAAHPDFTQSTALSSQTLLHLKDGHWSGLQWQPITWQYLAAQLDCQQQVHNSGYSFDNYTLLLQSAISGTGVAIGWQHLVFEQLKLGHLIRPLEETFTMDRNHYLVVRQERLNEPKITAVRNWILEKTEFLREPEALAR